MKKTFLSLFAGLLLPSFAVAQQTTMDLISRSILRNDDGRAYYLSIKEEHQISQSGAEGFINSLLFPGSNNRVVLEKAETDELGFTHLRYHIHQDNIRLNNRLIIAHCYAGKLVSLNGDLYDHVSPENGFGITESEALEFALKKVNAKKYKWQNEAEEQHMRAALAQPDFSYYPHGTRSLVEKNGKTLSAYIFNIYAEEPLYRANVVVNASTGEIIDEQNLICHADVPGTAATKYSGSQTITCNQNGSTYELKEAGRGLGVETYNLQNGTTYINTNFTSASSTWSLTNFDQGALDAHWGAEKTYDYFWTQHNRNSINNNGFKLLSYVHYNTNYSNAFWDGQRMTYGDGNGTSLKIFTTLDICGHEIAHGLTSNTGGLIYSYESGALNESYSDIFGACIENYGRPTNWNWRIGEDMTSSGLGIRNMQNPNQFSDPDTYLGTFWYTGSADNGGVHTNSGVSNFWFYLLTMGGSGTNDISNTYSVSGLGFTNAAKIAFRALTVYYTPSTNYANARALTIQSAIDLFGQCSNEMIQTTRAWYAVGVGSNYVAGQVGSNFTADLTNFCNLPATVNFNNTTPTGLSYVWDFGDGSAVVTTTNAVHTYTANGSYNVKLKATGCASAVDSITKQNFVMVNAPSIPVVTNANVCLNQSGVVTAVATDMIKWFSDPAGTQLFHFGNSFTTAPMSSPTTYYIANTSPGPVFNGGMTSNTGGGYLTNPAQWLTFNVTQTSTLNTVVVYCNPNVPGNRTIELRNASNTVLNTVTASLTAGANTVALYFPLTVGNNYRLGLANSSVANIYRSNTGVSYPYNIGGRVSIVNSSSGTGFYYWFYNWEVVGEDCSSPLVPVQLTVNPVPAVSISSDREVLCLDESATLSGLPAGGVFSGQGVSGAQFNASSFGPGSYTVNYTYVSGAGCEGSASKILNVSACTGLDDRLAHKGIAVYPNPARDFLIVSLSDLSDQSIQLTDVMGRIVLTGKLTEVNNVISLSGLTSGVYSVSVLNSDGTVAGNTRVVKQ